MDVRSRLEHALGAAYSIERELAGGGMSHVYVAEERAFGRRVVVKVLREELTEGVSAARFKREIAFAAKLQHPHIVPLLTAGDDAGTLFYTMPFIEGESRRDRVRQEGELPVKDVVRVLREVASALAYAHRQGIVHRDIKPENVLLSDGNAVVTDFGIAKALEAARTEGDLRASTISQLGVALGTPAYMAPEQAAADPTVDHRADLYALGCVGYELLAGRPPFDGRATRQLLAAHATETPTPIGSLRANTPPQLAALVMQCLEKRPADRPQSAADVLRALDGVSVTPGGTVVSEALPPAERRTGVRISRLALASMVIAGVVAIAALAARSRAGRSADLATYDVGLADEAPIFFRGQSSLSIGARGNFVVYVTENQDGVSQLRYRSLIDSVERGIPGTDGGYAPQVSPDDRSVAFMRSVRDAEGRTRARLEITDVDGGHSRSLGDLGRVPSWIRWVSPSHFFVADDDGLTWRWFDPQSGPIGSGKQITHCLTPSAMHDGRSLLCGNGGFKFGMVVSDTGGRDRALRWRAADAPSGAQRVIGSHFRVVDGKYLVFLSTEGELRAARIDPATLEVGRPLTLVSGLRRESYHNAGQYDISATGTLIYASGDNAEAGHIMVVHPRSKSPQPTPLIAEAAVYQRFDPSPDGRRLATVSQARDAQELRVHDIGAKTSQTWLTARYLGQPLWSPRGDRLVVNAWNDTASALVIVSPDAGSAVDTLLTGSADRAVPTPTSWRSDTLLLGTTAGSKITIDPRFRPPKIDTVLRQTTFADMSPDGRFLVFGRPNLDAAFITPFPSQRSLWQIGNAVEPQWVSPTTVRFWGPQGFWYEASVDAATGRVRGATRPYFADPRFTDTPGWSHRAVADGGMIYVQGPARTTATYLRVVPRWVERMERAVDSASTK